MSMSFFSFTFQRAIFNCTQMHTSRIESTICCKNCRCCQIYCQSGLEYCGWVDEYFISPILSMTTWNEILLLQNIKFLSTSSFCCQKTFHFVVLQRNFNRLHESCYIFLYNKLINFMLKCTIRWLYSTIRFWK
jgi:hypothetical protein